MSLRLKLSGLWPCNGIFLIVNSIVSGRILHRLILALVPPYQLNGPQLLLISDAAHLSLEDQLRLRQLLSHQIRLVPQEVFVLAGPQNETRLRHG